MPWNPVKLYLEVNILHPFHFIIMTFWISAFTVLCDLFSHPGGNPECLLEMDADNLSGSSQRYYFRLKLMVQIPICVVNIKAVFCQGHTLAISVLKKTYRKMQFI